MTNYTRRNERLQKDYSGRNVTQNRYSSRKKEESDSFLRSFIVGIIIVFGFIVCSCVVFDMEGFIEEHFGENSSVTQFFMKLSQAADNKEKAEFSLPFGLHRQNILFLGVDASGSPDDLWTGTRTDTMILINIDPKTKSVNALSIPRDSKVYLPNNNGVNKINAAHAIGGIPMTKRTVEDTLGVRVDRYIMVHDNAVKEIVDALGGIDMYIEKPMHYNDYSGKLHINFDKGTHHLDGKQAVEYLRFRHDAMGDIGRTQRQQWFLRSLIKELKNPGTIARIPDVISVAKKYVKTDMSLYEMSQYAALAKSIDLDKTEIAMLPGAPNQRGYVSYWILDPEKTQEVINRIIYRDKYHFDDTTPFNASVLYSKNKEASALSLIKQLKEEGITVKCTGNVNRTHSHFTAHSKKATNDYFNHLKNKNEELKNMQFVYDPVNLYCADTDFTVILAGE